MPLAADLLSEEEQQAYLDAIERGDGRALAARSIGRTATEMRRLYRRDDVWRSRVDGALDEQRETYVEELRSHARTRALGGSDRLVEVELATHVPGYEHLRRDRLKVDGRVEHAITFDRERLDALSDQELDTMVRLLRRLDGDMIVDGEVLALPPGEGHDDAEA